MKASWLLLAMVALLPIAANATQLSCQDPRLLDAVRRSIAETRLDESILRQRWRGGVPNARPGHPQCFGALGDPPGDAGTFWYGWRTFEGKTYVVWEPYHW